jgi:hypothetical protein
MLTIELLKKRFVDWQTELPSRIPASSELLSICLVQSIFELLHSLKSSFALAEDDALVKLLPRLEKIEETFRAMAYGLMIYAEKETNELYTLCNAPELKFELLEGFIKTHGAGTQASAFCSPLLEKPYPWDALAKARAEASFRAGFKTYSQTAKIPLRELTNHDNQVRKLILRLGGIPLVRKLTPQGTVGNDLLLESELLAAFAVPPGGSAWTLLT